MAARRVAAAYGVADLVLLFADTLIEDEDLYRFADQAAANIGAPLIRIAEGRDRCLMAQFVGPGELA